MAKDGIKLWYKISEFSFCCLNINVVYFNITKDTVKDIYEDGINGKFETRYSGRYAVRPEKRYKDYSYSFNDLTVKDIRFSPEPMTIISQLLLDNQ